MNNEEYNKILFSLLRKYSDIFMSLYSINDEELDDNLLWYLWHYNYVVMMPSEDNKPMLMLGESSQVNGFDRYGYVKSGIARYPEQLFSSERVAFDESNAVVIYSSKDKSSMQMKLYDLITELASIYFVERNNLRLSQMPMVLQGTKNNASILENIFNQLLLQPKSIIVLKDKEIVENLDKIDLGIKYLAKEYQASAQYYHNQILEMLGVNFIPHEKKERLIVDEANANNDQNTKIKIKFMKRIQNYFDKYNNLFGTDLSITENEEEKEIEENDNIENNFNEINN